MRNETEIAAVTEPPHSEFRIPHSLFDTHAHLADEQLAGDVAGVVSRAAAAGVQSILAVGTTAANSRDCLAFALPYPGVWSSAGIHPNHAAEADAGDWDEIVRLSQDQRVVALGETGLDLYWKDTPLPVQQDYFDRHIRLSQATGKPLVIHLRDTAAEILAMLREARERSPLAGIMHSFTGTAAQAAEFLDLGLHISFAGMVTFKKSDDLRAVAASIPADRILVETDSPYLSPEPFRGKKPNEPARVVHTADCLAQVRGVSLADFAQQTTANAKALFALS
jgi:TatD DNase family protein